MRKRICEMYLLEREQWLSEVLQKHQSSVIHSSIFIHSVLSESDKTVLSESDKNVYSMHCDFHTKRGRGGWDTPSFFKKRRFQSFESEILKVISLLGEKLIFYKSLFLELSDFLFIFMPFLSFKFSKSIKLQ